MTAPKVTGWYSGDQKPKRVGLYERMTRDQNVFWSFWTGTFWAVLCESKRDAKRFANIESVSPSLPWRGLAKKT